MDPRRVLFLGGAVRLPSVRIRCVDIAQRLGCDCLTGIQAATEIPAHYHAVICVKTKLPTSELESLRRRALVIWDVIDHLPPPTDAVALCLTSTIAARNLLDPRTATVTIPHYHCNFENLVNQGNPAAPAWIGHPHWRPSLPGLEYLFIDVTGMTRTDVVAAHCNIGVGLNFRAIGERSELHGALNSGIKLINCIGFGIPSISSTEPAYAEIGADCTLICDERECAATVRRLQQDHSRYLALQEGCLELRQQYHVDAIATRYLELFKTW